MIYAAVFLGIGAILTFFGILDFRKNYSSKEFAEGEIVGYKPAYQPGLIGIAVSAAAGMVHPIVNVRMPNGVISQLPLHTQIAKSVLQKFPDLQIGSVVQVTYFGTDPKEAFLVGHPLSQTPVKSSPLLIAGIATISCVIVMLVIWYTMIE